MTNKEIELITSFSELEVAVGCANSYYNSNPSKDVAFKLDLFKKKLYDILLETNEP